MLKVKRLLPAIMAAALVLTLAGVAYAADIPASAPQKTISASTFSGAANLDTEKSSRVSLVNPVIAQTGSAGAEIATQVTVKGETVYVAKDLPSFNKSTELQAKDKGEVGILATYSISGSLSVSQADVYGAWYFTPGETAYISTSWVPTSSNVRIGLLDSLGYIYYVERSGGSGNVTFQINEADTYSIVIWNVGPSAINYTGFITI